MTPQRDIPPRPTFAAIDLERLSRNFHSVRNFVGRDVRIMAVVKASAYGHGAIECARRLERDGADWFAVALLEEAAELRDSSITRPILCLGGFHPGQEAAGLQLNITPAVFSIEAAERLNRAAAESGNTAQIHLEIDTGMGRTGVPMAALAEFADRLASLSSLRVEALMSHFAAADDLSEIEFTTAQVRSLRSAAALLTDRGLTPDFLDIANSPGAIAHAGSRADLVRLGGVLYGLGRDVLPPGVSRPPLEPVLSLHSKISQVKKVPSGTSIGYGRTFVTTRESLIGTVPIGYNDGFRRELSNRGEAIVNGKVACVVGRVSMDWITLDLTSIPNAAIGDEVTLIGSAGGHSILAEDVAAAAGTISYEITCGISARVPRVYTTERKG